MPCTLEILKVFVEQGVNVVVGTDSRDLVLVDENPLGNPSTLRHPAGVTTRGRWLDRARLDQLAEPGVEPQLLSFGTTAAMP